jgi:hypothetical protein
MNMEEIMKISEEERQRRIEATNSARGSVRLEGFIVDDEVEALTARYIDGELTTEEHTAAILKLYKQTEPIKISDEERQKRLEAVNFARGSVRLEGFILSAEEMAENERYIAGEITIEDMLASATARYKK